MRLKGKLIKWDDTKAFGFILPNGNKEPIFIHKNGFVNRKRTPQLTDIITFTISTDKQGRSCAIDATYSGEKLTIKAGRSINKFSLYLAAIFLFGITAACFFMYLPWGFLYLYFGVSLFTFIIYASDKSKAKYNSGSNQATQRTPESTLHFLALIGGWPGAAFAQQLLRHKSKKRSFRNAYWLTVLVNLIVFIGVISPQGRLFLPLLN